MVTRLITPKDRDNARRLRAIWDSKKASLQLTQTKAAKELELNHQSTVSQYLNCDIALNTTMVLKFARILDVDPARIDPSIRDLVLQEEKSGGIPLLGTITFEGGRCTMAAQTREQVSNPFEQHIPAGVSLRATTVNTDAYSVAFGFGHESTVYIALDLKPEIDDILFIQQHDGETGFYRYSGMSDDGIIAIDPLTSKSSSITASAIAHYGVVVGQLAGNLDRRGSWSPAQRSEQQTG